MGIDRYSGIQRTKRNSDFNKKVSSGKNKGANEARVFAVSSRLNKLVNRVQYERSESSSKFLKNYLDQLDQTAWGGSSEAQVEVPPLKAGSESQNSGSGNDRPKVVNEYIAQNQDDIQGVKRAKQDTMIRLDSAVESESVGEIADLRIELEKLKAAESQYGEYQSFLEDNDLSSIDPELLEKIDNTNKALIENILGNGDGTSYEDLQTNLLRQMSQATGKDGNNAGLVSLHQAETENDLQALSLASFDVQNRMDASLVSGTGENIPALRGELHTLGNASTFSNMMNDFYQDNDFSNASPQALEDINAKSNLVLENLLGGESLTELNGHMEDLFNLMSKATGI